MFKIRKLAALATMSVTLMGCSSFIRSDYQAPEVEIPNNWQQTTINNDVKISPWWQDFNDPKLNQLIEEVLTTNNDLALATITLRQTRLQQGLSEDDFYPQFSSSSSASTSEDFDSGKSTQDFRSSFSIGYELDLWGKISSQVDTAMWKAKASQADRESTAQSLIATTATLYWQIGFLNQRIALSQANIKDAKQTLQLTEKQYQTGAVSRLNTLEAKRALAALQATDSTLRQQLTEANNAFSVLFNQPPQLESNPIKALPTTAIPGIAAGLPADLLIRRPDVKSALFIVRSNLAAKDNALASYMPTVTLTGALGGSSEDLSRVLSDPIGSLGADLVLPFLEWGDMQRTTEIANLEYQASIIQYRKTLYSAFEDVDNALSARTNYRYQGERLKEQYNSSVQSLKIYQSQYNYGAISIMDLLDAQENKRTAEAALLENRYNQFVAQATLYQALGGEDIAPEVLPTNNNKT